ncbi:MAG: EcsC family protein [Candidatus Omnitrophica bacterium]|nr:EcsC family protein [Candidatus Omnitrophota bacterium]
MKKPAPGHRRKSPGLPEISVAPGKGDDLKDPATLLVEIERWEKQFFRTGWGPGIVNTVFSPIDWIVSKVLPDRLLIKAAGALKNAILGLQKEAGRFADPQEIVARAREAGLPVETLEDLGRVPMPYLDVLARSFFAKNKLVSALQGAGFGSAGYATALLDYPLLFTLNLRLIRRIGSAYGFGADTAAESEFALKVFCMVSAETPPEGQSEDERMNRLIVSLVKYGVVGSELSILTATETIEAFTKKQIRWYAKKRLLGGVPIVGMVVGGGFDYLFTQEVAVTAFMFYRKRFLAQKGVKSCSS